MKKLLNLVVPFILVAALYTGFYFAEISCPIKLITGISCAGCGMTRACISALFGDFSAAFYFHPLWFLMPIFAVFLLAFYFRDIKPALNCTLYTIAGLFFITYIVRFFTTPEIVSFEPCEGIIFKLFQ